MGEGRGRRQRSRRRRPGCARSVLRQGAARPPSRAAWRRHASSAPAREESGGSATRQEIGVARRPSSASTSRRATTVAGPIVLVCAHGRRDACCARLGLPLFERAERRSSCRASSGSPRTSAAIASRPTWSCSRTGSSSDGSLSIERPRSSSLVRRAGSRSISIAAGRSTHRPCRQRRSRSARSRVRTGSATSGSSLTTTIASPSRRPPATSRSASSSAPGRSCPRAAAPSRSRRSSGLTSLESAA